MGPSRAFAALVLALTVAAVLATSCGNGAPSSRTPQGPAVVALPNSPRPVEPLPLPLPVLDRVVAGSPISFRLRASELANLFYQIDCLALTSRCSRAAYEDLWAKDRTLGGLDEGDRAALLRWKLLRDRYRGRIERAGEIVDIGLPVPRARRQVEARLRMAGYTADTLAHYAEHLSFFVDPPDVVESLSIVGRLQPRFAKWWTSKTANLARSIDGYARLFSRADVKEVLAEAARLYRPEFPSGYVMDLQLFARPAHDSPTSGQLIGLLGLIEVVDDEPPEKRFPVVAHEIFHAWFASAAYDPMAALVRRFTSSSDQDAIGAYGLLDESLATMLGNGRMARVVERADFEKRLSKPGGFYNDRFIDATAKSLLAAFDKQAPGSDATGDARFFDAYLAAVHAAFPAGLPPIARMRPLAILYDKSMRGAYDHLGDVANPGQSVSDDELDAKTMRELLENRGSWPLVLIVPLAKVDVLRTMTPELDKATIAAITQRARAKQSFVVAAKRPSRADVFVFVAANDAAMIELVDSFAARENFQGLNLLSSSPVTATKPD